MLGEIMARVLTGGSKYVDRTKGRLPWLLRRVHTKVSFVKSKRIDPSKDGSIMDAALLGCK
jgi:hypothetical protein